MGGQHPKLPYTSARISPTGVTRTFCPSMIKSPPSTGSTSFLRGLEAATIHKRKNRRFVYPPPRSSHPIRIDRSTASRATRGGGADHVPEPGEWVYGSAALSRARGG